MGVSRFLAHGWTELDFDNLAEGRKSRFSVIPAEAGIQSFQLVVNSLDSGDPVPAKSGNRSDGILQTFDLETSSNDLKGTEACQKENCTM
jgi:hypothetical protein